MLSLSGSWLNLLLERLADTTGLVVDRQLRAAVGLCDSSTSGPFSVILVVVAHILALSYATKAMESYVA